MADFFRESVYFGAFLSVGTYFLGAWMKKKWKLAIFNPLLTAIVLTFATEAFEVVYVTLFTQPEGLQTAFNVSVPLGTMEADVWFSATLCGAHSTVTLQVAFLPL